VFSLGVASMSVPLSGGAPSARIELCYGSSVGCDGPLDVPRIGPVPLRVGPRARAVVPC
jgi:hypothetical protein